MSVIIGLLFFLALIAAIVFGIRFLTRRRDHEASGDLDLIAYGLLAIAVGTSAFALVALAGAAFPDQTIVGGGSEQTATALAGLVVAVPSQLFSGVDRLSDDDSTRTRWAGPSTSP